MKGLVILTTLIFLTLHNPTRAYQVEGMRSDVICADIRFTVQCICNELGYFPTERLSRPCPWPNREKRSTDEDFEIYNENDDDDFYHPRALGISSGVESGDETYEGEENDFFSILSRSKRDIAFHEECCNIRTEHRCNRTIVELYCRRY
uniref:Androgenic hormone n=1 Tax=Cylisticus convexus TaxID=96835 RepID=H9NNF2_9CRUS|nr:androgenic hormone [Cylisticus convexus]